jgi:hypothetical protein
VVPANVHQIPLLVRVGSKVEVGDLNQEWKDAMQAAGKKPDLKALDSEVKQWFEKNSGK